jgi:hypothetical protein
MDSVAKRLSIRVLGMTTGTLLGYMWGWIWGWSLFDPNSDHWALMAGLFALLGLTLGAARYFWKYGECIISATLGLYLSWIVRTFLFGDTPGGVGILLMAGGVALGGMVGIRLSRLGKKAILPILLGALYFGFFGGLFIDVILLDMVLKLVRTHTILSEAPAVLFCGIGVGAVMTLWKGKSASLSVND